MSAIIPIKLVGNSLGERHEYLNNMVNESYENNVQFESLRYIHEYSGVDRLFKIHLANKIRHWEYILLTLQDEDMLYVSKALKCLWLIEEEFTFIINPSYLEQQLFPKMLTTASNKMRHWVQINLKDDNRCQEFYDYYKKEKFDSALKFLPNCPVDCILTEMKIIPLNKITPQLLKRFCEKTSKAAVVYFKELIEDQIEVDEKFVTSVNFLLKTDPDIYFFVIEKYFQADFKRLKQEATKYIMKNHRHRYEAKSELYAARILDLTVLARHLNNEEIKLLVTKLARAYYLGDNYWEYVFDYEFVEPLIKNVHTHEKAAFCKKIFQEKKFGGKLTTSPYYIPNKLTVVDKTRYYNIDASSDNKDYDILLSDPYPRILLTGGGGKIRTCLDELFNKYRFCSFEHTFVELQKCIAKESSIDSRRNMFLVLVSKTGGRPDSVDTLLRFLVERHNNEPSTLRAAVVRSLVKRAFVWRLPPDTWKLLLQFGYDLGLNGTLSDTECIEGIHCEVIRSVLLDLPCSNITWHAFIENTFTLNEYKLTVAESQKVFPSLFIKLLNTALTEPPYTIACLSHLLEILDAYHMPLEGWSEALDTIKFVANRNPKAAMPLLKKLFETRTACMYFIEEYFLIEQSNESYMNVLRHEAQLLESGKEFKKLITEHVLNHNGFLRKLAVYFGEDGGLAEKYSKLLRHRASQQPHVRLARPMALLAGANVSFWPCIPVPGDEYQQKEHFQMIKALESNTHLTRPKVSIEECCDEVKTSALAVWLHTCSPEALEKKLPSLLENQRHAKLVLALCVPRAPNLLARVLPAASTTRRLRALRIALRILRHNTIDDTIDRDWAVIRSLINRVKLNNKTFAVYRELAKLNNIPTPIRAEYSLTLYSALARVGFGAAKGPSFRIGFALMKCVSDHLKQVEDHILQNILKSFLDKDLTQDVYYKMLPDIDFWSQRIAYVVHCPGQMQRRLDPDYYNYVYIHLKTLAHYLLMSDSEWTQILRTQEILKPFLKKIREMWNLFAFKDLFYAFLKLLKNDDLFLKVSENCLPILETVQKFCIEISGENLFSKSKMAIHFTIIYRSAAKKCAKMRPDLYRDGRIVNKGESDNLILFVFGLMIAEDVEKVVSETFASFRSIYCDCLVEYMRHYFMQSLVDSATLVANGLIDDHSKVNAAVVGVMLYKEFVSKLRREHCVKDLQKGLYISLSNIQVTEVKFFFNSIVHRY